MSSSLVAGVRRLQTLLDRGGVTFDRARLFQYPAGSDAQFGLAVCKAGLSTLSTDAVVIQHPQGGARNLLDSPASRHYRDYMAAIADVVAAEKMIAGMARATGWTAERRWWSGTTAWRDYGATLLLGNPAEHWPRLEAHVVTIDTDPAGHRDCLRHSDAQMQQYRRWEIVGYSLYGALMALGTFAEIRSVTIPTLPALPPQTDGDVGFSLHEQADALFHGVTDFFWASRGSFERGERDPKEGPHAVVVPVPDDASFEAFVSMASKRLVACAT